MNEIDKFRIIKSVAVLATIALMFAIAAHEAMRRHRQQSAGENFDAHHHFFPLDCTPEQTARWDKSEEARIAKVTPAQLGQWKARASTSKKWVGWPPDAREFCTKKAYVARFGVATAQPGAASFDWGKYPAACTPTQTTRWDQSEHQRLSKLNPASVAALPQGSPLWFQQFLQVCTKHAYLQRFPAQR